MIESNEKGQEAKVLDPEEVIWIVPQCCREGWDTCKHVIKRDKKPRKGNIGL